MAPANRNEMTWREAFREILDIVGLMRHGADFRRPFSLEATLHEIRDQLREDDALAGGMMTAINVYDWHDASHGCRYGGTWRFAGEIIADVRGKGESYMDILYMQAQHGDAERACAALRRLGFTQCENDVVERGAESVRAWCDSCGASGAPSVDEYWYCDCGLVYVGHDPYGISWVRPIGTECVLVDGEPVAMRR